MTIQEAIKSGKKFRRKEWANFWTTYELEWRDIDSILATDWEVEPDPPKKVEIIYSQLAAALEECISIRGHGFHAVSRNHEERECIIKWIAMKLGLLGANE